MGGEHFSPASMVLATCGNGSVEWSLSIHLPKTPSHHSAVRSPSEVGILCWDIIPVYPCNYGDMYIHLPFDSQTWAGKVGINGSFFGSCYREIDGLCQRLAELSISVCVRGNSGSSAELESTQCLACTRSFLTKHLGSARSKRCEDRRKLCGLATRMFRYIIFHIESIKY